MRAITIGFVLCAACSSEEGVLVLVHGEQRGTLRYVSCQNIAQLDGVSTSPSYLLEGDGYSLHVFPYEASWFVGGIRNPDGNSSALLGEQFVSVDAGRISVHTNSGGGVELDGWVTIRSDCL